MPFETAIKHSDYKEEGIIIVESYATKSEAEEGHKKWMRLMTENPPEKLNDCSNSGVQKISDILNGKRVFLKGDSN